MSRPYSWTKRWSSLQIMKTTAKQIGIILLASAALAVAVNIVHPRRLPWVQDWSHQVESKAAELNIRLVSLSIALESCRSGDAVFIDARSTSEYRKGHIPGAVSIPFEQLDDHFPQLLELMAASADMVVYCSGRECDDALLLATEIKAMGGDAALFVDGYESWEAHGGEVER